MARYINPFSDWSFKRIFGQEYSKDLLIEFLNQLLLGEQHITDVKFKDKEMLPETKDQRGIIYDVFCETDTGEHIIVCRSTAPRAGPQCCPGGHSWCSSPSLSMATRQTVRSFPFSRSRRFALWPPSASPISCRTAP